MKLKAHNKTLLAAMIAASLTVVGCSSDDDPLPTPTPPPVTPTPTDPVVPPDTDTAPELSFVVSGSVVDSATGLLVGPVSLTFRENGVAATSIADTEGNTFSTLESTDGTFTFTVAEGATLSTLTIAAVVEGYIDEAQLFDLTGTEADTSVLLEMVSQTAQGVAVEVAATQVQSSVVVEDVVIEASAETAATTVEVSLPADTELLDATGAQVTGTSVSIEVTVVDVQEAVDPDTGEEIEQATASEVIPAGLNDTVVDDEIQVPVGVANVEMVDSDGNQIERFSNPITITINLPDDGEVAEGANYNLSSYDEDTGEWTNEPNDVTVGAFDAATNSFPASFQIDHLTFFALTRTAPGCTNDLVVNFSGDDVPAAGLLVTETSSDASASGYVPGGSTSLTLLSGDLALRYGVAADATARVRVFDFGNNIWFDSGSEVSVCGTVEATLQEPVTYVSETLNVTATCTNDTTISVPVVAGVTRYALPGRTATTAVNLGGGAYQLSDLVQGETYNVSISPRFSDLNGPVAVQSATVTADSTAETVTIPIACAGGTGAG